MRIRRNRHEEGTALLITVLMLIMMGLIGFAALDTVTRDQQVAGFTKRKKVAFFAAEAGVVHVLEQIRTDTGTPTLTTTLLSDTSAHPQGRPSFGPDTTGGLAAIEEAGSGAAPNMNLRIDQNGTPTYQMQYWRARIRGDAPGGSVARIEMASGRLIGN